MLSPAPCATTECDARDRTAMFFPLGISTTGGVFPAIRNESIAHFCEPVDQTDQTRYRRDGKPGISHCGHDTHVFSVPAGNACTSVAARQGPSVWLRISGISTDAGSWNEGKLEM